jgi:hypothetical protein
MQRQMLIETPPEIEPAHAWQSWRADGVESAEKMNLGVRFAEPKAAVHL